VKVHLVTAASKPWSHELRAAVEAVVMLDRFGEHALSTDPDSADLILLLDAHQHPDDWAMRGVRTHPYVRAYSPKLFVYDERDNPRDSLPGVYVSMPRRQFDPNRHRAGAYFYLKTDTRAARSVEPDLLFSFQGRRVSAVRHELLTVRHPRAVVEDTSAYDFFGPHAPTADGAKRRYCEVMGRSKFVICPRGAGTSSYRLFEALAGGRVPVILSDDWVAPRGIAWEKCSVRLPEHRAAAVGPTLEELEPVWPEMSAAASATFDLSFAPEVWFHTVVEACRTLRDAGAHGLTRQWTTGIYWRSAARHFKHTKVMRAARGR
jgi:hypothetical protein